MKLLKWSDTTNRYETEAVNAAGAIFDIGKGFPQAAIEIRVHSNGQEITIQGSGAITIRPEVANQIHIGVIKP